MASAAQQLGYTKVTCVHYARGDTIGKLLAHASLAPVLLIVAQAARVYARREIHEGFALVGLVASEVVARGLKHLVRSPRPAASCELLGVCDAHGMPSSHTTVAFFYFALAAATAAGLAGSRRGVARAAAGLEVAGALAMATLVAVSRVYLGYHSPDQVAAGAVLGALLGAAWFGAMAAAGRAGLFSALARWRPAAELLAAKDTWDCPDPLAAEQRVDYGGAGRGAGGSASAATAASSSPSRKRQ